MTYRLDIDESAIYDDERRVLNLDTGGVGNYSNDNWRAAIDLGARIVELLNTDGVPVSHKPHVGDMLCNGEYCTRTPGVKTDGGTSNGL
jgi:hypothetical protein